MLLDEVPAARPDDERRDVVVQRVALLAGVERDRPRDRVEQVAPGPRRQFCHVGEFASSKSAMKTLAPELSALITILRSTGPGDLDAPLAQVRRAPRARASRPRAPRASRAGSPAARRRCSRCPALGPRGEQLSPPRLELALEESDEVERLRRKDLGRSRSRRASDRDPASPSSPSQHSKHRSALNRSRIVLVDHLHKICLCIRSWRRSSRSSAAAR